MPPFSSTPDADPQRDLAEVLDVLPGAAWDIEAIQYDDGSTWFAVRDPDGSTWVIDRDDRGLYFAAPDCGERSVGIRDLGTAREAAEGLRRFVSAQVRRFVGAGAAEPR